MRAVIVILLTVTPAVAAVTEVPVPGILVSRQLAEARGIGVGDTVHLAARPAATAAAAFRVAAIYEPQPDPLKLTARRFEARLHLDDLRRLQAAADGSVNAIHVALNDPGEAETFAADLAPRLPGLVAVPTSTPRPGDPFSVLERFHLAIALVTVIGSAAFLLALMVMRAEERRETVGILRVLGVSRRRILRGVLLEGAALAVAGAVFGVLFALALQGLVNRLFQWRYDTPLVFVRVTGAIALRSVAFAVPLGILAGWVASWSLLRREIGALLRR
jgi:putative ABC transport system permease protein